MIKNLRHVGLVVSDMARSVRFYSDLGFRVIRYKNEVWDGRKLKVCKMTHGLELIEGRWSTHDAFTVDSLDTGESYVINQNPGVKFISDYDGNVIELVKEDDL